MSKEVVNKDSNPMKSIMAMMPAVEFVVLGEYKEGGINRFQSQPDSETGWDMQLILKLKDSILPKDKIIMDNTAVPVFLDGGLTKMIPFVMVDGKEVIIHVKPKPYLNIKVKYDKDTKCTEPLDSEYAY